MTLATVLFSRAEMMRNRSSDACESDVDLDLDFASAMGPPSTSQTLYHANYAKSIFLGILMESTDAARSDIYVRGRLRATPEPQRLSWWWCFVPSPNPF
jgi:hypothetical protein